MANTALVTGASGGIGEALAKVHAEQGGDLILVARSGEKLEALKKALEGQHSINVHVIAADLSRAGAAEALFRHTEAMGVEIDVLINNAGLGGHGLFHERDLVKHQEMLHLNIVSLTELTRLYLPGMVARGRGRVLNVSSTAGFMPGPLQAVYYATKAFVNSFSQAVAQEVAESGVTVTSLCPGAVNTGFQAAGDLDGLDLWDKAASADSVAAFGYRAMQRGELVAVNEGGLRFLVNWIVPLLPRSVVLSMSRSMMEKNAA